MSLTMTSQTPYRTEAYPTNLNSNLKTKSPKKPLQPLPDNSTIDLEYSDSHHPNPTTMKKPPLKSSPLKGSTHPLPLKFNLSPDYQYVKSQFMDTAKTVTKLRREAEDHRK